MSEYIVGERILDMGEFSLRFQNREEIVRCRDCEFFAVDELGEVCDQFDFTVAGGKMRDGFCAWGKRWGWDEE